MRGGYVLGIHKKRSWQTIRRIAMTSILKRDPRVSRPPGGLYRNYRRRAASGWSHFSGCAASALSRHVLMFFSSRVLARMAANEMAADFAQSSTYHEMDPRWIHKRLPESDASFAWRRRLLDHLLRRALCREA